MEYSKEAYDARIAALFERHQSVQSVGFTGDAYKPGLEAMLQLDAAFGRPSEKFRSVHVAGTNGKGTVCSMLAAQLTAAGMRVGLYTSPHLLDFRERIKVIEPQAPGATRSVAASSIEPSASFRLIPEKDVWDFLESAEKLLEGRSFFEITTALAFWWFARQDLDIAVIETGLGGRLDSTNIITPELSIITGIGLDHCAILGDTRAKIAAEKAGIFKPGVPAIVGEWDEETAPVFEARALEVHCPLFFANSVPEGEPLGAPENLGKRRAEGLTPGEMSGAPENLGKRRAGGLTPGDLPAGQKDAGPEDAGTPGWAGLNHPTVKLALDLLGVEEDADALRDYVKITGLRGRWETHLVGNAELIFDIGHNPPALEENFARLEAERSAAEMGDGCSPASVASGDSIAPAPAKLPLTIVYGVMADKDLASISHLMPADADYVLVAPATSRAMPAETLGEQLASLRPDIFARAGGVKVVPDVAAGVRLALSVASPDAFHGASRNFRRIIYIGGSTFVVSEAIEHLEMTNKWEQ